MQSDGIFAIKDDKLSVLKETPFENEDLLQKALADYPELLAGNATSGDAPSQLLLIRRMKECVRRVHGRALWAPYKRLVGIDHRLLQIDDPLVNRIERPLIQ